MVDLCVNEKDPCKAVPYPLITKLIMYTRNVELNIAHLVLK